MILQSVKFEKIGNYDIFSCMADEIAIKYSSTGVNYKVIDPVKKLAQEKAKETSSNLSAFNAKEISQSRGESAYVWEESDSYRAFVVEGLGTKNLVADATSKITGKSYYQDIAQDTVAMITNDIIVVGAKPMVVNAYFGTGGSEWFENNQRSEDLVIGFANACNLAGATWGGGETPALKGIINPETVDLGGACVGIINPKERLTLGDKITAGDSILLIESSGIHANGISLTRALAEKLPEGYATKLPNGEMFGEAILKPTHIYAKLVESLFNAVIEIHYMVNITGHGFRKIMRATQEFTYTLDNLPTPQPVFEFIQRESGNHDSEMYGNFNMGAGFAIILPEEYIEKAQTIAKENGFESWNAGIVENGPKQVIIKPKNITFSSDTLDLR